MEWEETRSWKEGAGKVSLLLKSSMIETYIINDNNSDKLNYEEGLIIEFWWKNVLIKSYLWSVGNMDLFMNFTCQWLWTSHIVCSRQQSCEVELQKQPNTCIWTVFCIPSSCKCWGEQTNYPPSSHPFTRTDCVL